MVMRGSPPTPQQSVARAQVAEADADRLWAALVALRGRAAAEASPVGQAHLQAVRQR